MDINTNDHVKITRRNQRERNRVKLINLGFQRLRSVVPCKEGETLSKISTLKAAIWYIEHLAKVLELPESSIVQSDKLNEAPPPPVTKTQRGKRSRDEYLGKKNSVGNISGDNKNILCSRDQNAPPDPKRSATAMGPCQPSQINTDLFYNSNVLTQVQNHQSTPLRMKPASFSQSLSSDQSSGYVTGGSNSSIFQESPWSSKELLDKFHPNNISEWSMGRYGGSGWLQNSENIPPQTFLNTFPAQQEFGGQPNNRDLNDYSFLFE